MLSSGHVVLIKIQITLCELSWILVIFSLLLEHANGGCGSDDKRQAKKNDECWYELWYLWLIVGLFLFGVLLLVAIYCKQHAKHSRIRDLGGLTHDIELHDIYNPSVSGLSSPPGRRANHQMVLPPAYAEPGHEPPTYTEAMTYTNEVQIHSTDTARTNATRDSSNTDSSQVSPDTEHIQSVPPPYSPLQRPTSDRSSAFQQGPTDVELYYSNVFAPGTSARAFFHHYPMSRGMPQERVSARAQSSFQEISFSRGSSNISTALNASPPYEYVAPRPPAGTTHSSLTNTPSTSQRTTTVTVPLARGPAVTRVDRTNMNTGATPAAHSYNLITSNTTQSISSTSASHVDSSSNRQSTNNVTRLNTNTRRPVQAVGKATTNVQGKQTVPRTNANVDLNRSSNMTRTNGRDTSNGVALRHNDTNTRSRNSMPQTNPSRTRAPSQNTVVTAHNNDGFQPEDE